MTTISARDFNRDVSAAKRAAAEGPVVITDRGKPAFVLLTIDDYDGMRDQRNIYDRLRMDDGGDIEFEPVILRDFPRPAER